jgi:hypothetical protein
MKIENDQLLYHRYFVQILIMLRNQIDFFSLFQIDKMGTRLITEFLISRYSSKLHLKIYLPLNSFYWFTNKKT